MSHMQPFPYKKLHYVEQTIIMFHVSTVSI